MERFVQLIHSLQNGHVNAHYSSR